MSWNVTLPSLSWSIKGFLGAHCFEKSPRIKNKTIVFHLLSLIVFQATQVEPLASVSACKPSTAREVCAMSRSRGKWAMKFWEIYLLLLISKDDFNIPIVMIRGLARQLEVASLWADSHLECLRNSITESLLCRSVCLIVWSSCSYQAHRVLIHTRWNLEPKDTNLKLLITLKTHNVEEATVSFTGGDRVTNCETVSECKAFHLSVEIC